VRDVLNHLKTIQYHNPEEHDLKFYYLKNLKRHMCREVLPGRLNFVKPQGQLQTQHSANESNYNMDNHDIKSMSNYRQALEKNTLIQRSKQTKTK
jgi:hypothetical protein